MTQEQSWVLCFKHRGIPSNQSSNSSSIFYFRLSSNIHDLTPQNHELVTDFPTDSNQRKELLKMINSKGLIELVEKGILKELIKILSIKIIQYNWPDYPENPIPYSEPVVDQYNCFQTIKISKTKNNLEVILIGSIGYFN